MTLKPKVFSGIQPSGTVHIGNFLGAIKDWAAMLDDYDCVFGIADYHAMTINYNPDEMQQRIFDAACVNIACGLDPQRCIVFVRQTSSKCDVGVGPLTPETIIAIGHILKNHCYSMVSDMD